MLLVTLMPMARMTACSGSTWSDFWRGLIEWFKSTLVGEATVHATDIDLFEVVDHPREVVDAIFRHYELRGFALSAEEQEMLMHL